MKVTDEMVEAAFKVGFAEWAGAKDWLRAVIEAALDASMPSCPECGTIATPSSVQFHAKGCSIGTAKPFVFDD